MQIDTNFLGDIREGVAHELQQLGYSTRAPTGNAYSDAHRMYMDHTHAMTRRVRPMPRMVQLSRELIAREPKLSAVIRGGLVMTAYELLHGHDVSPRLSRRVKKRDAKDDLLSDWGIHHLHLENKIEPDGYVKRNDDVLFVMVRQNAAFLIDIRDHTSWADDALVEIIHANWPDLIARYRYNAVRLQYRLTSNERYKARLKGMMSAIQVSDGTIYGSMGGGFTSTRESAVAILRVDNKLDMARKVEEYVRTLDVWLGDLLEHETGKRPDRVVLRLLWLKSDHAMVLIENDVKEIAFRVPISDS